jgi:hypothetical protein
MQASRSVKAENLFNQSGRRDFANQGAPFLQCSTFYLRYLHGCINHHLAACSLMDFHICGKNGNQSYI